MRVCTQLTKLRNLSKLGKFFFQPDTGHLLKKETRYHLIKFGNKVRVSSVTTLIKQYISLCYNIGKGNNIHKDQGKNCLHSQRTGSRIQKTIRNLQKRCQNKQAKVANPKDAGSLHKSILFLYANNRQLEMKIKI